MRSLWFCAWFPLVLYFYRMVHRHAALLSSAVAGIMIAKSGGGDQPREQCQIRRLVQHAIIVPLVTRDSRYGTDLLMSGER